MRIILLPLLLLITVSGLFAQSDSSTVSKIDKAYSEVSAKARAVETDDEQGQYGDLFVNEISINSRNHQWRAVGIYQPVYKFFFKAKGESLYPETLVFVTVNRKISDRNYFEELLFDERTGLIFYKQRAENDAPTERRVYFSNGKAFRIIEDGKSRDRMTREDITNISEVMKTGLKVREIFARTKDL